MHRLMVLFAVLGCGGVEPPELVEARIVVAQSESWRISFMGGRIEIDGLDLVGARSIPVIGPSTYSFDGPKPSHARVIRTGCYERLVARPSQGEVTLLEGRSFTDGSVSRRVSMHRIDVDLSKAGPPSGECPEGLMIEGPITIDVELDPIRMFGLTGSPHRADGLTGVVFLPVARVGVLGHAASIEGRLSDAALAEAIGVRSETHDLTTWADSDGLYRLSLLAPGQYSVQRAGADDVRTIDLTAGELGRVDL